MQKILYRKIFRGNLFGSRFVFLKKGTDQSAINAQVAKLAVEKIKGVEELMKVKLRYMPPIEAADWACEEVNRIGNNATINFKGENAEKYKKQIIAVAQKIIAAIDRNEKIAEFDMAEKKVTAQLASNLAALAKVGPKDIKFHKALMDTVFGLDAKYSEIEGMKAPGRIGRKKDILKKVQSQAAEINRKAISIITYWEGEIAKENAAVVRVMKALDSNPERIFPNTSDVNRIENHAFALESMYMQYGTEFTEVGLGRQMKTSIARLHNLSRKARKVYRTTIEDFGFDEDKYAKLDKLYDVVVSNQEALQKEIDAKRGDSNLALYLTRILKKSTAEYTKFRNTFARRETVLAGREVPSSIGILKKRLAELKRKKAPKGKPIRIAKRQAPRQYGKKKA